jgi:hypothetical protein
MNQSNDHEMKMKWAKEKGCVNEMNEREFECDV